MVFIVTIIILSQELLISSWNEVFFFLLKAVLSAHRLGPERRPVALHPLRRQGELCHADGGRRGGVGRAIHRAAGH